MGALELACGEIGWHCGRLRDHVARLVGVGDLVAGMTSVAAAAFIVFRGASLGALELACG